MSVRTIFRQNLITKKRFKNVGKVFGITAIILFNYFIIFQGTSYTAKSAYGEWGTSGSCDSGDLVSWSCYESDVIQCNVGETGYGFCP